MHNSRSHSQHVGVLIPEEGSRTRQILTVSRIESRQSHDIIMVRKLWSVLQRSLIRRCQAPAGRGTLISSKERVCRFVVAGQSTDSVILARRFRDFRRSGDYFCTALR